MLIPIEEVFPNFAGDSFVKMAIVCNKADGHGGEISTVSGVDDHEAGIYLFSAIIDWADTLKFHPATILEKFLADVKFMEEAGELNWHAGLKKSAKRSTKSTKKP